MAPEEIKDKALEFYMKSSLEGNGALDKTINEFVNFYFHIKTMEEKQIESYAKERAWKIWSGLKANTPYQIRVDITSQLKYENSFNENSDEWTEIEGIGKFKGLKIVTDEDPFENEITIKLKFDKWDKNK